VSCVRDFHRHYHEFIKHNDETKVVLASDSNVPPAVGIQTANAFTAALLSSFFIICLKR